MTVHSSFWKGTKLLVIFKDGRRVIDKYVEVTKDGFKLERLGRVFARDLRAVAVYKGRNDAAMRDG